ncbi:MAG: DNA topoisomerase (ATP-hydrolyzing) subunit A [Acutalibacteraceae bacterium]|nr:DNA topoisomerase (ATP-hydrolyzing) subunit A [Acutalibacteraceae bacterium]
MAKKTKKGSGKPVETLDAKTHILGAGEVVNQPITDTLELNFMPYAMSVIMSRAIPEIDGFKPSHRKILFTMYKMGLLTGNRSKSANIVGRTMQLNPHGDAAIYETMVRLSKGYEALLHPYVDSKGNFGKAYSRDMMWAASRYTEAKLDKICTELFSDIDKDTVDFVDNYDNTMKEPVLLPVTYPSVLVNANTGIAAGMASSICSFNLEEVCNTTIELLRNPKHDVTETLKGPDFSGGGFLVYKRDEMESIYRTGRGGFRVRAKYTYDKSNNCIDVTEIPPTTTSEAIIDRIIEKIKAGSIKEISDIRDETDKNGLKITIDIKKGTDPDKLMKKLYDSTPLQDTFSCNFNVLINGMPKVLGVSELLKEWIDFRSNCIRRRTAFDLKRASDRLHLLRGLEKILLDIDKAIKIIRNTEEESEVVPNLMIGFKIDKIQAEYVAEIKLRHLNKEYILKRLQDIEKLEEAIKDLNDILENAKRIKQIIIYELKEVIKKYSSPRKTEIIYSTEIDEEDIEEEVPDYPVHIFFTSGGYFKKITPLSLRMSGAQKLKEGDEISQTFETTNAKELLFFTNKCQVYKSSAAAFEDTKTSVLGDYIPAKLEMEDGETPIYLAVTGDYKGYMLFFFENGKVAKVDLKAYQTVTKRKKLIKAFSDKSPVSAIMHIEQDTELVVTSSAGRHLLINTAVITPKTTKDTIGVGVLTLKKGHRLMSARPYREGEFAKPYRYKAKNLPAAGALLSGEDEAEQITFSAE